MNIVGRHFRKSRSALTALVLCASVSLGVFGAEATQGESSEKKAEATPAIPAAAEAQAAARNEAYRVRLQRWRSLSPEERRKLIEAHRRFQQLPEDKRRRMRERLGKWQQMPPEERQRMRGRQRRFAGLGNERRKRMRRRLGLWRAMSEERRLFIRKVLAALKELPPERIEELKKLPLEEQRRVLRKYLAEKGIEPPPPGPHRRERRDEKPNGDPEEAPDERGRTLRNDAAGPGRGNGGRGRQRRGGGR